METASLSLQVRPTRAQCPGGFIAPRKQRILGEAEVLRLDPAFSSRTLQCARGQLWITIEGQAEDIVLKAGQTVLLPAGKLALVTALRPSVFGFDGRGNSTLVTDWIRRWSLHLLGNGVSGRSSASIHP